jgi:hypothetical protein
MKILTKEDKEFIEFLIDYCGLREEEISSISKSNYVKKPIDRKWKQAKFKQFKRTFGKNQKEMWTGIRQSINKLFKLYEAGCRSPKNYVQYKRLRNIIMGKPRGRPKADEMFLAINALRWYFIKRFKSPPWGLISNCLQSFWPTADLYAHSIKTWWRLMKNSLAERRKRLNDIGRERKEVGLEIFNEDLLALEMYEEFITQKGFKDYLKTLPKGRR